MIGFDVPLWLSGWAIPLLLLGGVVVVLLMVLRRLWPRLWSSREHADLDEGDPDEGITDDSIHDDAGMGW